MNCQFSQLLSRYFDGELPPAQQSAFERHLPECEPCRRELDQLASISRALRSAAVPSASATFLRRMQAISGQVEAFGILKFARRMSGVAAAVLVAVVGYGLLAHRSAPSPQQVLVPPWEQPSAVIEANLDSGTSPADASATPTDDSAVASNEPQFANLLVEDLSGGRP